MAKRTYSGLKLTITGAVAGVTILTAGWLAQPQSDNGSNNQPAAPGNTSTEFVATYAKATPTTINNTTASSATSTSSAAQGPAATPTAPATTATSQSTSSTTSSSSTAKTTRGS